MNAERAEALGKVAGCFRHADILSAPGFGTEWLAITPPAFSNRERMSVDEYRVVVEVLFRQPSLVRTE